MAAAAAIKPPCKRISLAIKGLMPANISSARMDMMIQMPAVFNGFF
jgi:hypothetical protein